MLAHVILNEYCLLQPGQSYNLHVLIGPLKLPISATYSMCTTLEFAT